MKLIQLLKEIKVNPPRRVVFDILTRNEAQKRGLINGIKNGEVFYVNGMKVFVEPKTYPLLVQTEHGYPYEVTLMAAKVKDEYLPGLDPGYREVARKQAQSFDMFRKTLESGGIPYKIVDEGLANIYIEQLYVKLDKGYVKNALRVDGVPVENLNEIKVASPTSIIDIKTSIPRDKAIDAIKGGFFHQDKDENDSLEFSIRGYNFKPEYIGNIDMEEFDEETGEVYNEGLEIYMAAFNKNQIKTLINLCRENKIFYLATERNMIIQIPETKYSYLSVNGVKLS